MRRRWSRGRKQEATCREVALVLQSYLDGEVDDLTARRVARHLEWCRRCGLEATTYGEIKLALRKRGSLDEVMVQRLRAFAEEVAAEGEHRGREDRGHPPTTA